LYQLRLIEWQNDRTAAIFKADCMYLAANALVKEHIDTDAVFAAEMLWDIQHLINHQAADIENILEQAGRELWLLYHKYLAEWENEKLRASHPSRVQRMIGQFRFLEQVTADVGKYQHLMDSWETASDRQCAIAEFRLLCHVPLLVAQLVDQFRVEYQDTFLDVANDQGHILTAMHLYNAAVYSGALESMRWEDMDWLIGHQSQYSIFAGDPPKAAALYARRFCMAYGLDQTKFSSEREPLEMELVENDIYLEDVHPVRLKPPAHYNRICAKMTRAEDGSYHTLKSDGLIKAMEELAEIQLDLSSPHGKPSNIGYLIAATEAYESDEEALVFDVFDFHLRCRRLLTSIRDLCIEEAPHDYPTSRFGGEQGVNPTLAELLLDLSNYPRHQERMWPKVVQLLRNFINEEGSECLSIAWTRMKLTELGGADAKSESGDSGSDTANETPPPEPDEQDQGPNDRTPDAARSDRSDGSDGSHTLSHESGDSFVLPQSSQQRLP
jgi:hypothetical protein